MDKIDKFLRRLSADELHRVEGAITDVLSKNLNTYDHKRLRGYHDIYRVRIGTIRVIYRQLEKDIETLEISRGSEKTYKKY